ncbi:MAG: ferrous iron transporter B [Clostridia bacterium]
MSVETEISKDQKVYELHNKILLMGNPNVGKSVFFSALTGVHVMSSNYAGTTVTYTSARMEIGEIQYTLVDVPGTYSLNATSEAEQVAVNFMNSGAKVVVCVLDATNLTRNLNLAFEILKYDIPVVFALNLVDIAERKGIQVSASLLSEELNAPVIKTVAVTGEGFEELLEKVAEVSKDIFVHKTEKDETIAEDCENSLSKVDSYPSTQKEIWQKSSYIAKKCTTYSEEQLKTIDKIGQLMVQPMPGIPIALLTIILSLCVIVFGGKGLRAAIFIPLVSGLIVPFFQGIIGSFGLHSMIENILIGDMGIFVIGFEWPISLILPYVTLFYVVFTFLEDCGFLPRIAVLFDGLMRKMGVQGGSLISIMMGYGCAVPAIIGSRVATTVKERLIITAMVCFAVPCISQSAAFITLLGGESILLLIAIFALSCLVIFIAGIVTGKLIKGEIEPLVIEVPNLLMPVKKAYFKKLMIRMKGFLIEAEGPMLVAVVIASVLTETGILDTLATVAEPFLSSFLGLPGEAVLPLLLGVIRREMAVTSLIGLGLSGLQIFVGATIALLYIPCLSVIGVVAKEFNSKVAVAIAVSTFVSAILLGGAINFVGQLFI